MKIHGLRSDYRKGSLDEADVGNDPLAFFGLWLDEAIRLEVNEPTAMALSTVSEAGMPSSRMVLLKGLEEGRFIFFTNYESEKGKHLKMNSGAALLFFWPELERQVRIEGMASQTGAEESDRYFHSRPYESRISALASPQSRVVAGRQELEHLVESARAATSDREMQRPHFWGGYALTPVKIEFWQGRAGRLHDRIRFSINPRGGWTSERLAP